MKRLASLLLVVLTLALAVSAQVGSFENKYNAPEFSATLFGCTPGHTTKTCSDDYEVERTLFPVTDYALDQINQVRYTQKFLDNDASVVIAYIDFPRDSNYNLDAGVSGILAAFSSAKMPSYGTSPRNVKELYPRFDTAVSGIPARGAAWQGMQVIDGDHPVTEYVRVFVKGNRLWEAILYCTNGVTCSDEDARTFFNSIVIK